MRKLSRNQVAIANLTLSVEVLRGRNFFYIRCFVLSAQCETNAAAFKAIAESGFYNGSKISTARREMPQLLCVFEPNMNTNCFIFNRDDPNWSNSAFKIFKHHQASSDAKSLYSLSSLCLAFSPLSLPAQLLNWSVPQLKRTSLQFDVLKSCLASDKWM